MKHRTKNLIAILFLTHFSLFAQTDCRDKTQSLLQDVEQTTVKSNDLRDLIDAPDKEGNTELMLAARDGDLKTVQALIDAGADVNLQNIYGSTALIRAAYSEGGHPKTVQALIDAGADVNLQNKYGLTALMAAAAKYHKEGYLEMVRGLINAGADVNLRDIDGYTARDIASENVGKYRHYLDY